MGFGGMGASEILARASGVLRRVVRPSQHVCSIHNSLRSLNLVPSTSAANFPCISDIVSHVHQFRKTVPGSLMTSKRCFSSLCNSFVGHVSGPAEHGSSLSMSGMDSLIWGRSFARTISSQIFATLAHNEGIQVKFTDKEENLREDEKLIGEHEVDSVKIPSLGESTKTRSQVEFLWRNIENCSRPGQTVAQIERDISKGYNFTKDDAIFLISRLRRYSRYKQAAEISGWMLESKLFQWTAYDQAVRLNVKGKLGLSAEVESIFNDSPPELQTEVVYNAVIIHFCEKGMLKKANEWLQRLIKSGQVTSAFAFNRLLVLHKDKGMGAEASQVLDVMNAASIPKDIYTYNILMSIKGKHKDVLGAEQIFEECKSDPNVNLDAATYATLAAVYIGAGLEEKAVAALDASEKSLGLENNGVEEVIATLWVKLGNKEKVLKIWETLKEKPTVAARTYIVMIETFGKLGMVHQAEMIFDEMKQKNGVIRPRHFTSLLSVYANNNMLDKVDDLVGRASSMGLKLNATLNHHIVGGYLKIGRLDKALAVVSEEQWTGQIRPWFVTMVGLLNSVAESGDVIVAEKIFDNLTSTYNQKNRTVYNILLKAYVKAGMPVEGFLERMAAAEILPNKKTRALLRRCKDNEAPTPTTVAPLS